LAAAIWTGWTDAKKTIIDIETLGQDLAEIQKNGYAATHEEHQEDLSAVAAPIFDHTEQVTAAVTVSGPTYRIGSGEIEGLAEAVQRIAHEISVGLGSIGQINS